MALEKNKTISAKTYSYHKIIKAEINIISQHITLHVAHYADRAHRLANESDHVRVTRKTIKFDRIDLTKLADLRASMYAGLKVSEIDDEGIEQNFFNGALDVLE